MSLETQNDIKVNFNNDVKSLIHNLFKIKLKLKIIYSYYLC